MSTTETYNEISVEYNPFNTSSFVEIECNDTENTSNNDLDLYAEPGEQNVSNNKQEIVSVFDVASYILKYIENQSCTTMKLHKLLYYCQAWSLVWDEKAIFKEKIEAWANGPVIPTLFYYHKGLFEISFNEFSIGNSDIFNEKQMQTINSVLGFYGKKSAQWLIDLTHMEKPWINARKGLTSNERGNNEIELDQIANYYSSL